MGVYVTLKLHYYFSPILSEMQAFELNADNKPDGPLLFSPEDNSKPLAIHFFQHQNL